MGVPATLGSLALGLFVGWLVIYFLRRTKRFDVKGLSLVISAVVGSAVLKFLGAGQSMWFYPIGLVLSLVVVWILAVRFPSVFNRLAGVGALGGGK